MPALPRLVFDFEILEFAFSADPSAILDYLREDSLPALRDLLHRLEAAVQQRNARRAAHVARRLRGNANIIGASALAVAMGRLERALIANDWDDAREALTSAYDVVQRVRHWVRAQCYAAA